MHFLESVLSVVNNRKERQYSYMHKSFKCNYDGAKSEVCCCRV